MPDRFGNLTPGEQAIVNALMAQMYGGNPMLGGQVGPKIVSDPGPQTNGMPLIPGVDYLPGIQYPPGGPDAGIGGGTPGQSTFGGVQIDTSLTGDPYTGGYGNLGGGPFSGVNSPEDLGAPVGGGPQSGAPSGAPSSGQQGAIGNSTATPSGTGKAGDQNAPAAIPGESVTYGAPSQSQSPQGVIEDDFNTIGNDPSVGGHLGASPSGLIGADFQSLGIGPQSNVESKGDYLGNVGTVSPSNAVNPGDVYGPFGGFAPTTGTQIEEGNKGDYLGNVGIGPQSSLQGIDPSALTDFAMDPSAAYGAYAGVPGDVNAGTFGDFGFGDFGGYTGDSAPAGGGWGDTGYSESSSGGGYGTDGFDGFGDGFGDDGFGDDGTGDGTGDDDGDDDGDDS